MDNQPNIPVLPESGFGGEKLVFTPENQSIERPPVDGGAERIEQKSEGNVTASTTPISLPQVAADNTTSVTSQPADTKTVLSGTNPTAAKDGDTIEKEWVDKAKQIIDNTKEDPYSREEQVKDLKADYLQKRYGRKLGDNN